MLKHKRPVTYRTNTTIELILPKFDTLKVTPQTGLGARVVSSSSQTLTIMERNGGKMVATDMAKGEFDLNHNQFDGGPKKSTLATPSNEKWFAARLVKAMEYYRLDGTAVPLSAGTAFNIVVFTEGTQIQSQDGSFADAKECGNEAVGRIGDECFKVYKNEYILLCQ